MEEQIKYPYPPKTERWMKMFYGSLNEKDKRHYAATPYMTKNFTI